MPEAPRYEQNEQGYWPLVIHPQVLADLQALPDYKDDFPYMLSSRNPPGTP